MNAELMKTRMEQFALRIIRLVRSMPRTIDGRAMAEQIIRSGTSVGANYRAACRARSRAEFISKIGIALEEADETAWWFELIIESQMLKASWIQPLLDEASELTAILNRSRYSARKNAG